MILAKLSLALVVLLLSVSQAYADFRVYLVPVIVNGAGDRAPKYFTTMSEVKYGTIYYGTENWVLVGSDLSTSDDAAVVAAPDAFALPFNLDRTLTAGQVTNVQTKLESVNIPAHWVTTSLTWKQVLRTIAGMSLVLQRLSGVNATNFFSVAVLNNTISSLPAQVRTDLVAAAAELNINTSGITGTTTIREALRIAGEQLRGSSREMVLFKMPL